MQLLHKWVQNAIYGADNVHGTNPTARMLTIQVEHIDRWLGA